VPLEYDNPNNGGAAMIVRVLLVWDQAMVHGVLSALLSLEQNIEIIAEESRGDEVLSPALDALRDLALHVHPSQG
jgi:two-component system, NarL family, response regulator DesR